MDASDEALRRLRTAASGAVGTVAEQRRAVRDAFDDLRRAEAEKHGKSGCSDSASSSRSRSRSRERKRKHKRKHKRSRHGEDGESLLSAARAGDADAVDALLTAGGVEATARDENRCTALHWCAVACASCAACAQLCGADSPPVSRRCRAALFGHENVVTRLLRTPDAARLVCKRTRRVEAQRLPARHSPVLTKHGTCSGSGATALHYAVTCGHARCAAALVAAGADAYAKDAQGRTPASLGLRALTQEVAREARLDELQRQREAAAASALASAAWEAAQAAGAGSAAWAATDAVTPPATRASARAQWDAYQAAWPAFEARAAAPHASLHYDDVPWPFFGAQKRLVLAMLALPPQELRHAVREERRRWHPDRWSRVRGVIAPADASAVDEAAGLVIRALNALADALAASEEATAAAAQRRR